MLRLSIDFCVYLSISTCADTKENYSNRCKENWGREGTDISTEKKQNMGKSEAKIRNVKDQ